MTKYKAYPEYKDSGVEFLGLVPNEWSVKSLKNIVVIFNGSTPKSGVEEYWDGDINWITPTDLSQKSGVYLNDSQRKITNKGLDSCGTSLVPENTVILSTRAPIGSLAIAGTQSCTNQGCKSLVVRNKEISLFLYYYLSISTSSLNNLGRGSTFLELSTEDLASFKVPMPNVGIGTIVSFLDHETAKIDKLIEKQQQLIELLKEKRQAMISHAVTKGLNPDVPMKDSGVEWLGKVPEHWSCTSLKYKANVIDCKHITAEFSDVGIPVASIGEVKNWFVNLSTAKLTSEKFYQSLIEGGRKPLAGNIIYSRNATVGEAAIVASDMPRFAMGQDVCLIKTERKVIPDFILYTLKSKVIAQQLKLAMIGSTFKRINVEDIRNFSIAIPSQDEQIAIVSMLKAKLEKYDQIIENAEAMIYYIQERRTALISAAVTGKIDVRDWVAPDMQDAEEPQETTA
ncbi:restriction endonuclease subunit S [Serratia marcescens]|uniref:restriction endonuclease subunit S n=1 Tax=Serratia marcescens TaxID=615 RepID=UPI002AB47546|nr:restriction endonuclease subunit S [Serratia marcescens]MDY7605661.1 restriction endonuclease subunit S [Serratia marcescens]